MGDGDARRPYDGDRIDPEWGMGTGLVQIAQVKRLMVKCNHEPDGTI